MGSKRRIADEILRVFPGHTCYVEVFGGGASVLLAKPPARVEVYNDVNAELVMFFRVARRHPREFLRQLRLVVSSREEFTALREARAASLTDVERAVGFFLVNRWSFGGRGRHYATGVTPGGAFQWRSALRTVAALHRRLRNVVIESLDFRDCLRRYDSPGTLFFLDPPYLGTAGYGRPFTLADHQALAETVQAIKGRAVVTINDTAVVRRLYASLPMTRFSTTVTLAAERTGGHQMRQLLIRSWR